MEETGIQGFYALAELLPEPMLLVSADGRILAANRPACRLLRSSLADLRGRTFADMTVQSAAQLQHYLRRCTRSRSFTPGLLSLRRLEDSADALRIEGARFHLADDDHSATILLRLIQKEQAIRRFTTLEARFQALSVEMRERVRAEQRERDLRQWLQGILSSIDDAVICTDLQGRVTFINRMAETLTGWQADEALDRSIHDIFRSLDDDANQPISDLVARALESGTLEQVPRSRLLSNSGAIHDVEQHAAPIRDSDGKLIGGVLVARDIQIRRNRERRAAAKLGITRILMTATSIEDASDEILKAIQSGFGAAVVGLWLPDKDGSRLLCQKVSAVQTNSLLQEFLEATRATVISKGKGLPGRVWEQLAPIWIDDVSDDAKFFRRAAAVSCNLHTGMALPIVLGETAYGVIDVYFDRRLKVDQLWIDSLVAIGSDIAQFIGRVRADQQFRRADLRHKKILDSALDCIITADADGRIVEFNPSAEATIGYRRNQVVGRSFIETIVSPSQRDQQLAEFQRHPETGAKQLLDRRLEIMARRADGSEFPAELTITCAQIADEGRIYTAFVRDVSGRRQGEEAQARLAAIVNSSDDSIIGKKPDGTIISWNAGAEQLYGYTADEALGQHVRFIVPQTYHEELDDLNRRIIRGERIAHFQTKRQHRDGRLIDVSLSLSPVCDASGNIIGISSIARDISIQLQAEENLKVAMAKAEEATELKSQFLAAVSHELRTPMNAIIGMTDLALSEDLPLSIRDYLETSRESAAHLLSLLNDLLDFSKIEAGKFRLESSPFRLRQAIDKSVKTFALQSHDQGIDLTQFVERDVPDHVVGDEQRVRQVITNLISNALKFTERGDVSVRVSLEDCGPTETTLKFTVADTGIGIAPEQQQQLFKRFSQLDVRMSRRSTGTGLGLAISAEFVSRMQGRIWVESEENAGAVFHFTARLGLDNAVSQTKDEERTTLNKTPVLVIEDKTTTATVVSQMLSAAGARPAHVADVGAAVSRLKEAATSETRYAAAIIDAALLAGEHQLIKTLSPPEHGAVSMIILTSPADGKIAQTVHDAYEMSTILDKPVFEEDLIKAVRRAVDGESPQPRSRHRKGRPVTKQTRGRKVLVAEDTRANQKLLSVILSKASHEVEVVSDGSLAVAAVKEQDFDIILMDVQMPIMDGIEATKCIRDFEKETDAHTPIVALTAHAMRGFSDRCRSAGMDSYITKPIDSRQLLDTIARLTTVEGNGKANSSNAGSGRNSGRDVLDLQAALTRLGNDSSILEMMAVTFWEDAPLLVRSIQDGLASGNAHEVHRASHSLKSLAAGFDAHQAAALCQRIEELSASGDLVAIQSMPEELTAEVNRVSSALRVFFRKFARPM